MANDFRFVDTRSLTHGPLRVKAKCLWLDDRNSCWPHRATLVQLMLMLLLLLLLLLQLTNMFSTACNGSKWTIADAIAIVIVIATTIIISLVLQ